MTLKNFIVQSFQPSFRYITHFLSVLFLIFLFKEICTYPYDDSTPPRHNISYFILFFSLTPPSPTCMRVKEETSLLRRLQAQTLPGATPPIGKIYPFTKIAIPFNQ